MAERIGKGSENMPLAEYFEAPVERDLRELDIRMLNHHVHLVERNVTYSVSLTIPSQNQNGSISCVYAHYIAAHIRKFIWLLMKVSDHAAGLDQLS